MDLIRKIFVFAFFLLAALPFQAQTISSIAKTICDSIHEVECVLPEKCEEIQRGIYNDEMLKYPTLVVDITDLNKPHQYNEFSYKINRELRRNCGGYIDQFSLLPLSKILDVEGLMNKAQYDSLERKIIEFIAIKKTDLLVVCIDNLYPYETGSEFTKYCFERLNVGRRYAKGGIVVLIRGGFILVESSYPDSLPLLSGANADDKQIEFGTIYSTVEKLIAN